MTMTKRVFTAFADAVRGLRCERDRETMARFCADVFKRENPRFNAVRFADACGLPLEALEPERMGCILERDDIGDLMRERGSLEKPASEPTTGDLETIDAFLEALEHRRDRFISALFGDRHPAYIREWTERADRGPFGFWRHLDSENQKRAIRIASEMRAEALERANA